MSAQTRLFIGSLPDNCDEKALREVFSNFGVVQNFDVKTKENDPNKQKFAFVTLDASNYDVELCLGHFTSNKFNGHNLYVTRARESFLERLQRERQQAQQKTEEKSEEPILPKKNPTINLSSSLNPRNRRTDHKVQTNGFPPPKATFHPPDLERPKIPSEVDQKRQEADKKRLESMKKKRQEFKQKQMTIKTALVAIDSVPNKKIKFSDCEDNKIVKPSNLNNNSYEEVGSSINKSLFNEDDDDDDDDGRINFEIKEQFEGKKGQKILELQSKYKSDSRFVLDQRFVETQEEEADGTTVEVGRADETVKQLNILQDVLGVSIRSKATEPAHIRDNKKKTKMGMLRFDPTQPDHARFLAPALEPSQDNSKKKKKDKAVPEPPPEVPRVEVSLDQFYKVSDTLKESIAQPNSFSLRSLFSRDQSSQDKEEKDEEEHYIPLEKKEVKFKNPLDLGERNPFKYDSSESEDEETEPTPAQPQPEPKPFLTKLPFFFAQFDDRLQEGLAFFNEKCENEDKKDRRELKSLMKKRLYNKERKEQMFQKKIGGKKKSFKKPFNKRSKN